MKKCCFIIPYFGKMPNYFPLFLKSCSKNKDYNWIIITDDDGDYEYPVNTTRVLMAYSDLKSYIQSYFDFPISLEAPYKLCDFRPAYGLLFEKYLSDYLFWGFCDLDLIVGDINSFITESMLKEYDKLFCLGHMTLFRNTEEGRKMFMQAVDGEEWYKEAFTVPQNVIFDEVCRSEKNIHNIYLNYGKRVLEVDYSANFRIQPSSFIKATYIPQEDIFQYDKRESLYIWDNGHIMRYFMDEDRLLCQEYLYIHLQERNMKVTDKNILTKKQFKIIPNEFRTLEYETVTKDNYSSIKKKNINLHWIRYQYKWKIKKIKKLLRIK